MKLAGNAIAEVAANRLDGRAVIAAESARAPAAAAAPNRHRPGCREHHELAGATPRFVRLTPGAAAVLAPRVSLDDADPARVANSPRHALLGPEARMTSVQTDLQREVAALMVEALNLDAAPDSIAPDAPLYGEGLGLDSIDILEVALVVSQRYGFQLRSDDADNVRIFTSLASLTDHIAANRAS